MSRMESYEVLEMQERRLKEGITSLEEQLEPLKSGRMHLEKDPNGEKTKREIARFEASTVEKQMAKLESCSGQSSMANNGSNGAES